MQRGPKKFLGAWCWCLGSSFVVRGPPEKVPRCLVPGASVRRLSFGDRAKKFLGAWCLVPRFVVCRSGTAGRPRPPFRPLRRHARTRAVHEEPEAPGTRHRGPAPKNFLRTLPLLIHDFGGALTDLEINARRRAPAREKGEIQSEKDRHHDCSSSPSDGQRRLSSPGERREQQRHDRDDPDDLVHGDRNDRHRRSSRDGRDRCDGAHGYGNGRFDDRSRRHGRDRVHRRNGQHRQHRAGAEAVTPSGAGVYNVRPAISLPRSGLPRKPVLLVVHV